MKNRKKGILIACGLALLLASVGLAANNGQPVGAETIGKPVTPPASPLAGEEIPWLSLNAGGTTEMTSTNFGIRASAGQSVAGASSSANYKMGIGFWYGPGQYCLHRPGDATGNNGTYGLADVIAIVNYAFNKPGCSPTPLCWLGGLLCRGDWNQSGNVGLGDAIQGVNFVFNKPGGPWNAKPVGVCCLP